MIKVAIVDDHSVVRIGIKSILANDAQMTLVAEGCCAADALEIAQGAAPDVLLLDLKMPGEDGISALRKIMLVRPDQKILVLTTSDTEEDVYTAIRGGAKGYLLKETAPELLLDAIRTVADGKTAFPDEVMKIYEIRKSSKSLSPREREVLQAATKGLSNAEIANVYGISTDAVKIHFKHIFRKLDVTDRTEAVVLAIHRGMIDG